MAISSALLVVPYFAAAITMTIVTQRYPIILPSIDYFFNWLGRSSAAATK
jgi:hypothetical protein